MAKKKIELFLEVNSGKEFEHIVKNNFNNLICAEVYSSFVGSCTALDRLFNTIKLDWSDGKIVLLKVLADEVDCLRRFRDQSQPIYLFIFRSKVTKVFRGVDGIRFAETVKRELHYFNNYNEEFPVERPTYDLDEPTSDETEWISRTTVDKKNELALQLAGREARQAVRKRHRAEVMVPHLGILNFVLFWPHCKHAHPELYERWDINGIIMIGREEIQLTEEKAKDILYEGDAPINEASIQKLLSGPALVLCFRLLDTDKHFVSLVRKILYEDYLQCDSNSRQLMTAYEYYMSYSLNKGEILRKRQEQRNQRKEEKKERRARRQSEMQRLARQAHYEAIEARRAEKEKQKLELLKAGNLEALKELKEKISEEELEPVVTLESSTESEETSEDENEYFPPSGLPIPGFYAPPNDIAKANGLAILFPKIMSEYVTPQPEYLPPHVLVMLEISKRHKTIDVLRKYKKSVIHMGIFDASSPHEKTHVAYSVKEYDAIHNNEVTQNSLKIAIMLSIENDIALLMLMDLNPVHVSRDEWTGEEECAAMFSVDYGDMKLDMEDFV